jgi:hypothetical protein
MNNRYMKGAFEFDIVDQSCCLFLFMVRPLQFSNHEHTSMRGWPAGGAVGDTGCGDTGQGERYPVRVHQSGISSDYYCFIRYDQRVRVARS